MSKALLLAGAAAVAAVAAHAAPAQPHEGGTLYHAPAPARAGAVLPHVALPGFAAVLADRPLATGAMAWPRLRDDAAWAAIAAATPATRQAARWALAGTMIAGGRGAEASGVLAVMLKDDPDLGLVPAWQRANGVALGLTTRSGDALVALAAPALGGDAEACLWRMRLLAEAGSAASALAQIRCAMPALLARNGKSRAPFLLAGARAAIALDRPRPAMVWLDALPDGDAAANLLRGKAFALLGDAQAARLRFDRVALTGTRAMCADAALSAIEAELAARVVTPAAAARRLDQLVYGWRGDDVEARALRLMMRIAIATHDDARLLGAGAALYRYGEPGADTPALVATLRATLAAALAPSSKRDLTEAAGLLWDYRDIAPAGAEGNRLAESLVERLQAAGLYDRAADLLDHRLSSDAQDVEQGPLAVRIASLRILAGKPDVAIRVLRATDGVPYPAAMRGERLRVEAAALHLMGRRTEALAALDDVPDGAALSAELYWRSHDWANLAAVSAGAMPPADRLGAVGQAMVLRRAIALAMLGREADLVRLRARYAAAFRALPTDAAFTLLTERPGRFDPAALGAAMAALPSASPAGSFGDLLDGGKAAMTPVG